jgi:hypothetical protein
LQVKLFQFLSVCQNGRSPLHFHFWLHDSGLIVWFSTLNNKIRKSFNNFLLKILFLKRRASYAFKWPVKVWPNYIIGSQNLVTLDCATLVSLGFSRNLRPICRNSKSDLSITTRVWLSWSKQFFQIWSHLKLELHATQ